MYVICTDGYPYLSNFAKPLVILLFMPQVRNTFMHVLYNIKDSVTILCTIAMFVAFFSVAGYTLFQGTLQGY